MGNESSVEMDPEGTVLQQQDSENLWKIILSRGREGESEGVCIFTRKPGIGSMADFCEDGLEHLRVLRHPNILKFVGCEVTDDCIAMVTEPVVPIRDSLEGVSVEGAVMGWRGVASGLAFLHSKAHISHNNLSIECVFVSTVDSVWKIGGFEAASKHKSIDADFLSSVSSIRHEKAIPPEDKTTPPPKAGTVPCHARDIWAFGHFILVTLDETALENDVSDSLFTYVQEEMLNPDPDLRPTASDILNQPWMSNHVSQIIDFLSKLTLKTQMEKDQFFGSLAGRLHSLPQAVVAEHIVPLLITPLVMAEPLTRKSLWKHLLSPISHTVPRPDKFDPTHICPLLDKTLFAAHVLPLLLNLLESRELHVRLILLEYMCNFVGIISTEDLHSVVLPEVLVGLSDDRDEVVQFTLHALADLVPLLGSEAIIGSSLNRSSIFTDSRPRGKNPPVGRLGEGDKKTFQSMSPGQQQRGNHHHHRGGRGGEVSRKERMEQMRAKREEQRLKRKTQTKLGKVAIGVETTLLEPPSSEAPPTDPAPQYSPSVSHDEELQWNDIEEESSRTSSFTNSPMTSQPRGIPHEKVTSSEGEEEEEWEEFDESTPGAEEGGSGEIWRQHSWSDQISSTSSQAHSPKSASSSHRGGGGGGMKLKMSSARNQSNKSSPVKSLGGTTTVKSYSSPKDRTKPALSEAMKGRLNAKDRERLQEQASWTIEPDFFADMAPAIVSQDGSSLSLSDKAGRESVGLAEKIVSSSQAEEPTSLATAMQYQASEEAGDGGWGEEEWDDF